MLMNQSHLKSRLGLATYKHAVNYSRHKNSLIYFRHLRMLVSEIQRLGTVKSLEIPDTSIRE